MSPPVVRALSARGPVGHVCGAIAGAEDVDRKRRRPDGGPGRRRRLSAPVSGGIVCGRGQAHS